MTKIRRHFFAKEVEFWQKKNETKYEIKMNVGKSTFFILKKVGTLLAKI